MNEGALLRAIRVLRLNKFKEKKPLRPSTFSASFCSIAWFCVSAVVATKMAGRGCAELLDVAAGLGLGLPYFTACAGLPHQNIETRCYAIHKIPEQSALSESENAICD